MTHLVVLIQAHNLRNKSSQSHGQRFLVATKWRVSVVKLKPRSKDDRPAVACDP